MFALHGCIVKLERLEIINFLLRRIHETRTSIKRSYTNEARV